MGQREPMTGASSRRLATIISFSWRASLAASLCLMTLPGLASTSKAPGAPDYDRLIRAWKALRDGEPAKAKTEIARSQSISTWPEPAKDMLDQLSLAYLNTNPQTPPPWTVASDDPLEWEKAAFALGIISKKPLEEAAAKAKESKPDGPKQPKPESTPELSGVAQLRSLWKAGNVPAASRQAKATAYNSHLKGCQPDYAYAQFILARVKRASQDRKGFDEHQQKLMKELDKRTCTAAAFTMTDSEYKDFLHDERLWASRLDWENRRLASAGKRAKAVLDQAIQDGSSAHAQEALAVLSGRIFYESLPNELHLDTITALESRLQERSLVTEDFQAEISMRRALLAYESRDYTRCAQEASKARDLTAAAPQSPRQRREWARTLFWKARCVSLSDNPMASQAVVEAWQTIGRIAATGYYSMRMAMEFPELAISERPGDSEPFQTTDRPLDAKKAAELSASTRALLDMLGRSKGFKTLPKDSLLRQKPSSWLMSTLQGSEFDLFVHDPDTLARALQWMRNEGHVGPSILSGGRLAAEFRLDHPKADFIRHTLYPQVYGSVFREAQRRCAVDALVLYAVTRQESLFGERAVSSAGAQGLMQLMPSVWKSFVASKPDWGLGQDPFEPQANAIAGACHLREALAAFGGNLPLALAGYNAGVATVRDWLDRRHQGDTWLFIEMIPYAETQNYVRQILRSVFHLQSIRQNQIASAPHDQQR